MSQAVHGQTIDTADWNVAVTPFSYNPSSWRQRIPICVLAFVAFLMATHMALYQWRLLEDVWDPVFGEQSRRVLDSNIAQQMHLWIGIPDAALGALAYLGDAIFGLAGSTRRWQYRPWMVILFGLDVIPLGIVGAILVVCQATIVGHWCLLCLMTAAISLVLVYMAYDEVYASLLFLYRIWRRSGSVHAVWTVLWGRRLAVADEVAEEMVREAAKANPSQEGGPLRMWSRVVEFMLACWLAVSPVVFAHGDDWTLWIHDFTAASIVALLAIVSYWPPLRYAHLGILLVALWLIAFGRFSGDELPPVAALQNHIAVGLLLLMFAIVPIEASLPPKSWRSGAAS